jgi:hypothetical protein
MDRTLSMWRASRMCVAAWLVVLMPRTAAAERRVACENPPGGAVICEDDKDTPKCTVDKGQFKEGKCLLPPSSLRRREDIEAWILSEVTGTTVTVAELGKYAEVLKSGKWQKEGRTVTFKVPESPR